MHRLVSIAASARQLQHNHVLSRQYLMVIMTFPDLNERAWITLAALTGYFLEA
jgi:hypothetical protein